MRQRSVLLPDEVAEGFRSAIEIFRRYHAPWEETAALLYWSQALFAASQARESFQKFEAAFAIFDQIATPQWNARIADRRVSLPDAGQPFGTDNDRRRHRSRMFSAKKVTTGRFPSVAR